MSLSIVCEFVSLDTCLLCHDCHHKVHPGHGKKKEGIKIEDHQINIKEKITILRDVRTGVHTSGKKPKEVKVDVTIHYLECMDEMQRRHLELIVKNPDLLLYVGEFAPTDDLPVVADSRKLDMARKRNKKREDIKRLAKKRSGTQEFVKATSFHEPPRGSEPQRWQTPARQSYRLAAKRLRGGPRASTAIDLT